MLPVAHQELQMPSISQQLYYRTTIFQRPFFHALTGILNASETLAVTVSDFVDVCVTIVCIVAGTMAWIKVKKLRSFPHITPIYLTIVIAIREAITLTTILLGKEQAFSGKSDLFQAINNPTSFFLISGAGFQFVYLAMLFWWMFAVINMWWIRTFPNKAKRFVDNATKIHVFQSVVAWGAPSFVIAVLVEKKDYTYGPFNIKSCLGSNKYWTYFSLVLPHQITATIGMSLLIWTCFRLRQKLKRRCYLFNDEGNKRSSVESLEFLQMRLIFVFIGLTVFSMIASIYLLLNLRNANVIKSSFQEYAVCTLLSGSDGDECSKSFRQHLYIDVEIIALYSWPATVVVFLLYFAAYKNVRKLWLCVCTCGLYVKKRAKIPEKTTSRVTSLKSTLTIVDSGSFPTGQNC